jgi:hypothetical protein
LVCSRASIDAVIQCSHGQDICLATAACGVGNFGYGEGIGIGIGWGLCNFVRSSHDIRRSGALGWSVKRVWPDDTHSQRICQVI